LPSVTRAVRFSVVTLFDEHERTDLSPSPESEDLFSFLNRSARPDVVNIRAELERWFGAYPEEHQAELRSRFRDRRQHSSAWWELYLHRLFTLLGFGIEVHPDLEDADTHPDFRVTGPAGTFLLEAATTEAGIAEPGRDGTREGWIIDALNSAPHPNFFVSLRFQLVGQERPVEVPPARPSRRGLAPNPTSTLVGRPRGVAFRRCHAVTNRGHLADQTTVIEARTHTSHTHTEAGCRSSVE
jgi:hypothetical protein